MKDNNMSCKLDNLEGYTHRKHPYYAKAIQLTAHNRDEIIAVVRATNKEAIASTYGEDALMVRFANPLPRQCSPDTMYAGDWVVTGENGVTKIYTNEAFNIKYEKVGE
jgi:hypothetical protein